MSKYFYSAKISCGGHLTKLKIMLNIKMIWHEFTVFRSLKAWECDVHTNGTKSAGERLAFLLMRDFILSANKVDIKNAECFSINVLSVCTQVLRIGAVGVDYSNNIEYTYGLLRWINKYKVGISHCTMDSKTLIGFWNLSLVCG